MSRTAERKFIQFARNGPAKKKYLVALNLGLLGFGLLLSLFETSRGKENFLRKSVNPKHYIFSVGNLEENDKRLSSRKLEQNEV